MTDRSRWLAAVSGASLAVMFALGGARVASGALNSAPPDSSHGGPRLPLPIHYVMPSSPAAARAARSTLPAIQAIDDGIWSLFNPSAPVPPTPSQHVGVFDTARNRMIVHGGYGLVSDTWALDLGSMTWSQIMAVNPPTQRWGACAIYDPVGDQVVMFGGYADGNYSNELWRLPLQGTPSWVSQSTGPTLPIARLFATAIYDPVRRRMIVFGGEGGPSFNDTWALDLATMTWSQIVPNGTLPSERFGHTAIYDPVTDEMVIYGGAADDVWALSLGANPSWRQLVVTAGPSPGGRTYHTAIYDSHENRMVIHGGWVGYGLGDTWQLGLGANPTWVQLAPAGPAAPARWLHNAIYDPGNFRMIVFGGSGTGDLRALNWAPTSQVPVITSLVPAFGIAGDNVAIHGLFPETPSSVQFNGLNASIDGSGFGFISVTVPVGVTTGRVTAVFPSDTLTSPTDFTVLQPPVVSSLDPPSGFIGDVITISGQHLAGANRVSFGDASHASFTVVSDQEITATVDPAAVTGPVTVYNAHFSTTSGSAFTVLRNLPVLTSIAPVQGTFGTPVVITGQYLSTASSVSFGPNSTAQFTIVSDTQINATVDPNAVTGPITVQNRDGTTTSSFSFVVRPPAYPVTFAAVLDAPNDQGGKVILEWLASDYDIGLGNTVVKYRIWRRAPLFGTHVLPASGTVSAGAAGATRLPRVLSGLLPSALSLVGARPLPLDGAPAGFWESIGEVPAARIPGYAFTAPTLQDSLPGSNPYTAFIIQSITNDPTQLYFSDPDSGYSVDNLAPPIPTPFVAIYGSSTTALHWTPSRAPDFAEFRLYRGSSGDFVPDASNLIVATNDTSYVDATTNAFYKLAALDVHGNHSKYAVVSPSNPAAVLAGLSFVDAEQDRIRLAWYAAGEAYLMATLYRRTPATDWVRIASLTSDSGGLLQYEDRSVIEGGVYGYRLGIVDAGVEVFAGEVWATASRPHLTLEGILPNPTTNGRITVAFVLPTDDAASLELLDIAGRRVASRDVGSLGRGRHQVTLEGSARLAPGVYLVRLVQAQSSRTMRAVVIE